MKLSALEIKRLSRLSASARAAILDLEKKGSRLHAKDDDKSRAMANKLYQESDRLYAKEVLNRKFTDNNKTSSKLTYDYMGKQVRVDTVKSDCCDGYNIIEYITESNDDPRVISGPFLTKHDALLSGEKYVLSIIGK